MKSPDKRCRHERFVFDDSGFDLGREVRPRLPINKDKEAYYRGYWNNYKAKQLSPEPKKRLRGSWITQSGRW